MADESVKTTKRHLKVRHNGRVAQIGIFFLKFLRMFIYQNDWKVLPMAALIGGLVGFVMSSNFMVSMEGTITGSFALACICIWNGSFNSIQVICRERDVVKREHRSGMHISSYIIAHMLYQLLLCVLQTIVTVGITYFVGMKYPTAGLISNWYLVDFGITVFLITYAADMMSLWISSLSHSTTAAMTVMPFLLVFQLMFSGGVIVLPKVAQPISSFTISSPGIKSIAGLSDANTKPSRAATKLLNQMDGLEINGEVTFGQVLDALSKTDNKTVNKIRSIEVGSVLSLEDLMNFLLNDESFDDFRNEALIGDLTVGGVLSAMKEADFYKKYADTNVLNVSTVGDVIDTLSTSESAQSLRDESFTIDTTLGDVLDMAGKKESRKLLTEKISEMNYRKEFAHTADNLISNWFDLICFILVFSLLSIITLEFIDKDKR